MPRTIWKGAITFGLVNIPVALRAASRDRSLDFDWLDRRDMAPVGYKRINKRTGEAIASEDIVKGYEYENGQYVLMTDEDFKRANPRATQSVDILAFVDVREITPDYFVTPYYLEALRRGEKGYALLREVMRRSGRVGVASVVMHSKQHLAALLVQGPWLKLNTMRFPDELLPPHEMVEVDDKALGDLSGAAGRELDMAQRLVDEMTVAWNPSAYRDTYREDLLKRIEARIEAGETHELAPAVAETAPEGAQIIDLMTALRESLARKGAEKGAAAPAPASTRRPRPAEPSPAKAAAAQKETSTAKRGAAAEDRKPARKAAPKTEAPKTADAPRGAARKRSM